MSDIFICYSKTDRAIATRLGQRLRDEGWSVFIDRHIDAGHRWSEEIESQLAAARAVLTLWSSSSLRSRFVLDEAHDAAERRIIFPARIEEVSIPYGFRQFQTPDLIGWDGLGDREEWQRIVAGLHKHLGSEASETSSDGETRPKTRGSTPTSDNASDTKGRALGQVSMPLPSAGQTFRDRLKTGADGPLMIVIPAGRFRMGSPPDEPERPNDEGPQHEVRIAAPFAMGVYTVTFEDYERFCDDTKRGRPGGIFGAPITIDNGWRHGNRPVIKVSWQDAQAYCAWLTAQTGRTYRLPSEAEWEYACRAGTNSLFYFGARITTEQANFHGNFTYNGCAKGEFRKQTVPVGSFPPYAFGLHDLHGNVWEWCQDIWHGSYEGAPSDGLAWEGRDNVFRVLRGGSWYDAPWDCRAADRSHLPPGFRDFSIGFRVCCAAPIE